MYNNIVVDVLMLSCTITYLLIKSYIISMYDSHFDHLTS